MLDEFRSTLITWDKATSRIYSPVTANASDSNGRKLNIQVVNSGQVENLTGATLHLYWETKDKERYGLDAFDASDISKGEFEIFYTTGMLSNVGELNATLVLVDSTGKVVSDWFKITVTRGINEGAIESENSFSSLTQALIDISNLEQNYAPRLNDLAAQLQQTENEITTHVNKTDIHKPIRVFEREPNIGEINNGDLLFIYDNVLDWTPTKWEVGSLQSGNGEPLPATHRVRAKDYIPITPGEYKSFVTGPTINPWDIEVGTVNYLFYTESNSFISTTSWVTNGSNITIPSDTVKMKVIVRLPTDTEVDVNLANDTIKPVLTKVYR